jgi:nucleotide-binding universal stress UspA family protein
MYRILVPLDGSARAERAIPWADELGGALGAEVELLRVVGPNDLPDEVFSDAVAYQVVENESRAGRATLDLEAEQFVRVTAPAREIMFGVPGATIAARAQVSKINLIVMSSHGRGDLERAVLGSVADEVIRDSRVPVLVIGDDIPSPPSQMPKKVLIPLDGSELSEAVLTYVTPLAQSLGWNLVLFWQVDLPRPAIPVQGALISLDFAAGGGRADMVEYLDRIVADLQTRGVVAEPRVWFGSRPQSIIECASDEHIDLIAMSTHGRKGLGRWLRGSVTQYVLKHATVPVLTVRPHAVPMSSAVAARLSKDDETEDHSLSVTLNERQARAAFLALEHLTWASGRQDRVFNDAEGALLALDTAAAGAGIRLSYGDQSDRTSDPARSRADNHP